MFEEYYDKKEKKKEDIVNFKISTDKYSNNKVKFRREIILFPRE